MLCLNPFDLFVLINNASNSNEESSLYVRILKSFSPLQVGHTIHIAGLARLDVEELSVDSIYVTVWASSLLPLHMGKTENADRMLTEHFGQQLQVRKP